MFNKKTIALLEREIVKVDGKLTEANRAIEFRDGQIKRLVRQIAKMDEKQKELEAENKKLWDMYYASEKVRKRLAGDNPSVSCADSSLYTREPMEVGNNGT